MTRIEIPLSAPDITDFEIEAVVSVLRSPRLSLGPKLEEFERSVAEYVGSAHAVGVSSGTAVLLLIEQVRQAASVFRLWTHQQKHAMQP